MSNLPCCFCFQSVPAGHRDFLCFHPLHETLLAAGTALGDPIELGAALSVLHNSGVPLQLTAAKSCMGHSEPAAGGVGMNQAALMLASSVAGAVMHLRHFNPMLGSLLQMNASQNAAALHVPRQANSRHAASPGNKELPAIGVSAFAFQGTNSHAILVCAVGACAARCSSITAGQQRRYWFAAPPDLLASRLTACGQNVELEAVLVQDALAHLWDHQVQQRPLFPAAAMLAAAHAAGVLVLDGAYRQSPELSVLGTMLTSVTIPVPLVLPHPQSYGSSSAVVLSTVIAPNLGWLHQRTTMAAAKQGDPHLRGVLAFCLTSQSNPSCSVSPHAALLWSRLSLATEAVPAATADIVHMAHQQAEQYTIHPEVMDNVTQASVYALWCLWCLPLGLMLNAWVPLVEIRDVPCAAWFCRLAPRWKCALWSFEYLLGWKRSSLLVPPDTLRPPNGGLVLHHLQLQLHMGRVWCAVSA